MAHRCCSNYRRSRATPHVDAAEPGRGLTVIEEGMPTPAGTGLSRRTFMVSSLGFALTVYGATRLGPQALEEGIANAATPDRIVVSVFLDGGMDALSLLAPTGDAQYPKLQPTLALSPTDGTAFTEDPRLRWHPAASPLATLHGEGKVTV